MRVAAVYAVTKPVDALAKFLIRDRHKRILRAQLKRWEGEKSGNPHGHGAGKSKPIDYGLVTCGRRSRSHWCAQPVVASAGASKVELERCLGLECSVEPSYRPRSPSVGGLECKTRAYRSRVDDIYARVVVASTR
jgi:hypothetical protein